MSTTERTVWVVRYQDPTIISYCKEPKETFCFTEYPENAHEFTDRHDAYALRDSWRESLAVSESKEVAMSLKVCRRYRPCV